MFAWRAMNHARQKSLFFVVGAENGETNKIGVIANNDSRKAFFSCWNTGFLSFFVGSEFHMNDSLSTWRIAPCRVKKPNLSQCLGREMVMTLITEIVINSPFAHSPLSFITPNHKNPGDRHQQSAQKHSFARCGKAVVSIGKTRMSDENYDTTGTTINSRLLTELKAALRSHRSD